MKCLTTQGDVWLLRKIWNESICIHQSLTLLKSFKFQTILGKIHVIHVKKKWHKAYVNVHVYYKVCLSCEFHLTIIHETVVQDS